MTLATSGSKLLAIDTERQSFLRRYSTRAAAELRSAFRPTGGRPGRETRASLCPRPTAPRRHPSRHFAHRARSLPSPAPAGPSCTTTSTPPPAGVHRGQRRGAEPAPRPSLQRAIDRRRRGASCHPHDRPRGREVAELRASGSASRSPTRPGRPRTGTRGRSCRCDAATSRCWSPPASSKTSISSRAAGASIVKGHASKEMVLGATPTPDRHGLARCARPSASLSTAHDSVCPSTSPTCTPRRAARRRGGPR